MVASRPAPLVHKKYSNPKTAVAEWSKIPHTWYAPELLHDHFIVRHGRLHHGSRCLERWHANAWVTSLSPLNRARSTLKYSNTIVHQSS